MTDEVVDRRHSITGEAFYTCKRAKNGGHSSGRAVMAGGNGKRKVPCKEKRSTSEDNGRISCGSVFLFQRHRGTRNNFDL